jgi:hypothetical protein
LVQPKTKAMKNQIIQFSLVIIAFVALTLLMSYTRPAADEAKQYIVITEGGHKFENEVNQKLSEGWHLQGGVSAGPGALMQAMVK